MKRQNLITAWHDRRIVAGSRFGAAIDTNLDAAEAILILISPDFIASDYCYDREMKRAMQRHERGEAKVIPVVLRPCDWHDLPFGKLLAAPKDGKPITTWANTDEALLDVERAIKAALSELRKKSGPDALSKRAQPAAPAWKRRASALGGPRSSNLRVKEEFSDLDLDRFPAPRLRIHRKVFREFYAGARKQECRSRAALPESGCYPLHGSGVPQWQKDMQGFRPSPFPAEPWDLPASSTRWTIAPGMLE